MLSLNTTRRSFWFIFELQDVERVTCGLSTWAEIEHKNFKCCHVGLVKIDSEIILGQVGNLMETLQLSMSSATSATKIYVTENICLSPKSDQMHDPQITDNTFDFVLQLLFNHNY